MERLTGDELFAYSSSVRCLFLDEVMAEQRRSMKACRSAMKLSFSLKGKAVGTAPPLKPVTPFTTLEDDPVDAASTLLNGGAEVNKHLVAQSSSATSRATRKKLAQEKKVDETIFEYDEVYDLMEQAKQRNKEKQDIEARERKVRCASCYVAGPTLTDQWYSPSI